MFRLRIFLLELTKKMWPKVTAFVVLAGASALAAVVLRHRLPENIGYSISRETVGDLLNILASTMLAVTTFSLTVMVSAYASATTTASPRATRLVMEDHTAQNVMAVFLGAFVFGLVGIIALNAGVYRDRGRLVLFFATLLVFLLVIVALIRWIDHLTRIGRVSETTGLVQEAASKAMELRAKAPFLGCNRLDPEGEGADRPAVMSPCYGYVQFVDTETLSKLAEKHDRDLFVRAMPGCFVTVRDALAELSAPVEAGVEEKIRRAFRIGRERAFEQDPRFGVCVLAEIALRSLPPTANDPGTVIDVLGRLVEVLAVFAETDDDPVRCRRVWVPPLLVGDLFDDAFNAISQDSAGLLQIQIVLQKSLRALERTGDAAFRRWAEEYSRLALRRAEASGRLLPEETELLSGLSITRTRVGEGTFGRGMSHEEG